MSKIVTYSNWCYIDRLDGEDIKDGELLLVTFPDGKELALHAKVDSYFQEYQDHGHTGEMPVRRAFYTTEFLGAPIRVPLSGLEAKRLTPG